MLRRSIFLPGALLVVTALADGAENVMLAPKAARAPVALRFVSLAQLDVRAIVPAPPEPDTVAGQADLETVRQVQVSRTSEDIAWAKLVETDHVFNHASVLGPWFSAERLPRTAAFFEELGGDLRALDGLAKQPFLRQRPTALDPALQPCVALPASSSYPSGSAMQALVWAELLAEIFPAKRDALLARAHRAGWGRVIGGVHFPSDIVAGHWLGGAYLAECRKSAEFRAAWAAARDEIKSVAAAP